MRWSSATAHSFRFVDTAGIRRKGKTKLMAEKLAVDDGAEASGSGGCFAAGD